jgi:hypothetical protein
LYGLSELKALPSHAESFSEQGVSTWIQGLPQASVFLSQMLDSRRELQNAHQAGVLSLCLGNEVA